MMIQRTNLLCRHRPMTPSLIHISFCFVFFFSHLRLTCWQTQIATSAFWIQYQNCRRRGPLSLYTLLHGMKLIKRLSSFRAYFFHINFNFSAIFFAFLFFQFVNVFAPRKYKIWKCRQKATNIAGKLWCVLADVQVTRFTDSDNSN